MFSEKKTEYSSKQGKEIPVWQSDKYLESRDKAVEIIKSGKYGLVEADFWILMNETKSGKMAYSGLIISHNGCLKINDALDAKDRFRPECVTMDKDGYNESLVFSYSCTEQGLYEVGEVNAKNCRIDYPYAMAFKRMFDRVVLKQSKLAYSGIYSEVEADEFKRRYEDDVESPKVANPPPEAKESVKFVCSHCGKVMKPVTKKDGSKVSLRQWESFTKNHYEQTLCYNCLNEHYPGWTQYAEELA